MALFFAKLLSICCILNFFVDDSYELHKDLMKAFLKNGGFLADTTSVSELSKEVAVLTSG